MSKVILFLTPTPFPREEANKCVVASNRTQDSCSRNADQQASAGTTSARPLTLLLLDVLFLLPFGRPLGLFGVGDPLGS